MKKLIFPLIAVFVLLSASGCSTKFKIDAPYKNITVVYGFLDVADTAHYIRIEKAFLDQNKNALTMATVADSNFYANLNVKIERIDAFNTGKIIDTIHLNKVDLTAEGYPKQPGTFFTAPNYAYKFTNTLVPYYTYRLIITNLSTGQVDSSETPIIDDNTTALSIPILDNILYTEQGIDFNSTLPNTFFAVNAIYTPVAGYSYKGYSSPINIAQVILTFNWIDSNISTGTTATNSYAFNAGYLFSITGNNIDFTISDISLYNAVASGLGTAPTNIQRILLPCTLSFYAGTPDFSSYEQITVNQGTGLTANEIEPVYTNIQGNDALGLYTSRGVRSKAIGLSAATVDSLQSNPLTAVAHIVGQRH